jgi:hypothetical protein
MDRTEYNSCMSPWIKGKGISQEDRRLNFCAGAKVCTGKASSIEEAKKICLSQPPKEPKERSTPRRGRIDLESLAVCIEEHGTEDLRAALTVCLGRKVKKPESKNKFLKDCVAESVVNGSFAESIKLRKQCIIQWNEKHPAIGAKNVSEG